MRSGIRVYTRDISSLLFWLRLSASPNDLETCWRFIFPIRCQFSFSILFLSCVWHIMVPGRVQYQI
jgi:hypothetical protein